MTTSKFLKLITLATGMVASACSFAATGGDGDIWDIRPCDRDGNLVGAYASIESPIQVGGKSVFFKLSLETRNYGNVMGAKPWMLKHVGVSSELLDDALYPLQIGIFVSGKLEYADLVEIKPVNDALGNVEKTEFIFEYVSRSGDVALPVVLATQTTDGIKPATDDSADSFSYLLNRTDKWSITNENGDTCNLFFAQNPAIPTGRVIDYTLAKCGIYIQTINFDSNWESAKDSADPLWRSVHEGSSVTGGSITPKLEALATPDHAVTLYVWSDDDSAVFVKGGKSVTMVVGYENGTPITKDVIVGEITFGAGQNYADFQLQGAPGGNGKKCNLILSAWQGYSFDASNVRMNDYVTVPVKCLEPLPPTVVVTVDRDIASAKVGDGWKEYSAIVDVVLTQPVASDIDVTITPAIVGYDGEMNEYVRFSTTATSVKTIAALTDTVTVKISAGELKPAAKIYAFFLKADKETSGGKTLDFMPMIPEDQKVATGLTTADRFVAGGCEVVAELPVIAQPEENDTIGATAGVAQPIEIQLEDTYAAQQIKPADRGYEVEVRYNESSTYEKLKNYYYIGEGGFLRDIDGNLPELKYATSSLSTASGEFITQIRITDPINGKRVVRNLVATVAAPRTVSVLTENDTYNEGDTAKFTIELNADNDTGATLYAFLVAGPDETKAGHFSALGRKCLITPDMTAEDYLLTKGVAISPGNGGPGKGAVASIKLLDGLSEEVGGSSYYFSVALCTTPEYREDTLVSRYSSNFATIQVFNVPPTITRVEMNKYEAVENGGLMKFEGAYPIGQTQTFQAIVKDAGGYDLTTGFTTRWTITRIGGGNTIPVKDIVGNPNDDANAYPVTFNQAGTYKIKVQIKDKDMSDWAELFSEVYVDVVDQPQLTIVDLNELDGTGESSRSRKLSVGLGGYYNAAEEMIVMLTVVPPGTSNPGVFELDAAYESIPVGFDPQIVQDAIAADGTASCKHYFLRFRGTENQEISVVKMDGTRLSTSPGFTVKAQVLNRGMSSDPSKTWAQYYLPLTARIYIENESPLATVTAPNTESNRWEVAGGAATQYPIRWTIRSDVDDDYTGIWDDGVTKGIRVSFSGCENASEGLTYVTSRVTGTSGTFVPNFGSVQGDQIVTMTIEDKDGGYETYTYLYKVTPSKFLTTISTGPSGGTSTSGISQKYARLGSNVYGTLGAGHTYVGNGATFSNAENFRLRWNCSKKMSVDIYAFGYKVASPRDDGSLDGGMDIAINANGRVLAGAAVTNPYIYPMANAANPADRKDSFLYCWILHSSAKDSGAVSEILGGTISPEVPGKTATGRVTLPTEQTEDGSYLETEVEAIFSREWNVKDNLGDINGDGIPDVFAVSESFKGGSLIRLVSGGEIIENDLMDLAGTNPDADYLPGVYAGVNSSFAPVGRPFTTRMEIRGFGDGLNALDLTKSEPDFTEDEEAAWKAYAEANSLNPDVPNLEVWSPEPRSDRYPRMDPTIEDTDADGLSDGWEYYFWYQAHVTKRAKPDEVSFERFDFDNVVKGIEISADEVEARFNPCAPLSADVLKSNPDFDNDGLSDFEEFVIGTNPAHWDTDGDRMCDGWEVMMCLDPLDVETQSTNPDGDFMAFYMTRSGWVDAGLADPYATDAEFVVYLDIATADVVVGTQVLPPDPADPEAEPTVTAVWELTGPVKTRFVKIKPHLTADGEILRYGLKSAVPLQNPPANDIRGYFMVDVVESGTVELAAGTVLDRGPEDYVLIHDQVRTAFGFDPRTAWNNVRGYVANRWNPSINSAVAMGDTTGAAINTRPYYTYDEYLVMLYRRNYGISYYDNDPNLDLSKAWDMIRAETTNPNVVYPEFAEEETEAPAEGEETDADANASTNKTVGAVIAERLEEAFKQAGSSRGPVTTHGADTDLDGVPDGWELYVGRNPSCATRVPGAEDGQGATGASDYDADGLSFMREYAGTDSCDAYAGCESIYKNHPGIVMGWYNKFFPTNPGINLAMVHHQGTDVLPGADTDLDGIADGVEGRNWAVDFYNAGKTYTGLNLGFIYGAPADDGSCCIRGAGMNPCTIDTDLDGIPDGWEMQHAGIPVDATTGVAVAPLNGGMIAGAEVDSGTLVADGIFARIGAAAEQANSTNATAQVETDEVAIPLVYIAGGMDATYSGDVVTDAQGRGLSFDPLLGTVRDVDFDHDGLQNFQEYLIQSVRHFRYDDISTPLMGRVITPGVNGGEYTQVFKGFVPFDAADPEQFAAKATEAWGTIPAEVAERTYDEASFVKPWSVEGWRSLGYFAQPLQNWDRAAVSLKIADPLYMWPVTGMRMVTTGSVAGYVTTDPRMADTDGDGMDDYYEMFHGLNPILGTSVDTPEASTWSGGKAGDIISATYNEAIAPRICLEKFNAYYNEWIFPAYGSQAGRTGQAPILGGAAVAAPQAFDPVMYPWIMGTAGADADGDGLRNEDERILANAADPMPRHTDPTPLWFTERTTPSSYVAQYYLTPERLMSQNWTPGAVTEYETASLTGGMSFQYMFGFEEGEGYDTDGDFKFDGAEVVSAFSPETDPINFADPDRRQALWLDGVNSYAISKELQVRPIQSSDLLKQFTVECWVMPAKSGAEQTIVERSVVYSGNAITGDAAAIRANFRLGLYVDGRVYGMFDNSDSMESGLNHPVSCQRVDGVKLPLNEWSHVALAFNGSVLSLYVNGELVKSAETSLIPANGVSMIGQSPTVEDLFPTAGYKNEPAALVIGARPKKAADVAFEPQVALAPYFVDELTGDHYESFENMREYFGGWIDEVRVWDGERTAAEIKADFRKRYTFADVAENRSAVAYAWINEATRNNNDGKETLPAELLFHYNFMTLPGAVEPTDVAKTPAGFATKVLGAAMSDYASNTEIDSTGLYSNIAELKGFNADFKVDGELNVGWWNDCLTKNKVYTDYHVVPWIQNTVSHLPAIDGNVADSFIYSTQFGAVYTPAAQLGFAMFNFPNSAVPYSYTVYNLDRYMKVFAASRITEQLGESYETHQKFAEFAMRSAFTATTDLVPLGNAYAKTCTKMWDRAVADAWELTVGDEDADGLPDWWEEYALSKYSPELGADGKVSWDTLVDYNGRKITAGDAFKLDIIMGLQPNGTVLDEYKATVDTDGDNIPDWWEKKYNIFEFSDVDDCDGDGLSNWAEYLLSEVFDLGVKFDPIVAKSVNGFDLDYFVKVGELYAGEIFSDHDYVEDQLEDKWGKQFSSRYAWDALADADEDGWSNFAEARYNGFTKSIIAPYASHVVGDSEIKDMPIPTLRLTLRYNGAQPLVGGEDQESSGNNEEAVATLAPIVVKTYTRDGAIVPDATFSIQPGAEQENHAYIGPWEEKTVSGTLTPGYVNAASFTLEYAEVDRNDSYTFFVADLTQTDAEYAAMWPMGYYVDSYDTYMELYTKFGPEAIVLQSGAFEWSSFDQASVINVTQDVSGENGYICMMGERIGTINLKSGDYTLDLTPLRTSGAESTNSNVVVSMAQMVLRLKYNSMVPGMQSNKLDLFLGEASKGYVKEGRNLIVAFYDLDGDGNYTPGEPMGTAAGVDVGWNQAKAEIELTDTCPIMTRADLISGTTDRETLYGTESGDAEPPYTGTLTDGKYQRVRIVRTLVNGAPVWNYGIATRVVMDKMFELDQRKYIFEGDILENGALDLDWEFLYDEVVNNANIKSKRIDVTTMTYAIIFGDNLIDLTGTNNYFSVCTQRKFDAAQLRPQTISIAPGAANSVVFGTHPTFKWRMTSGANTYTAFKINILDEDGNIVWDSGYRRAPACDLDGVYTFEADAYIGDELENNKNYSWRVSMYNAKFKEDAWSTENYVFRMNAPTSGAGYANIPVSVKYFGPSAVAEGSEFVVEAFTTPDFTGIPAARAVVSDVASVIESGVSHSTNAVLVGVPAGKYYLRAYADMDVAGTSKRVRDAAESWGYVCKRGTQTDAPFTPATLTVTDVNGFSAPIDIYLEDVDTNGNCLPDAWELVNNGGKLDNGAGNTDATVANAFAINKILTANIQDKVVGAVETDAYNNYIMMAFASPAMTALALGYDPATTTIAADGSITVQSEVESVEIASVGFDADGNVYVSVQGKLDTAAGDSNGLGFLVVNGATEKTVTCKVLYKSTLAQADWNTVATKTVTIGASAATIDINGLGKASSGFFKVIVTK